MLGKISSGFQIIGILSLGGILILGLYFWLSDRNQLHLAPPSDYTPPSLAEIQVPTTAESSDSVADPYSTLHQDTWTSSGPTQMVGDIANPQDQYRRAEIPVSIIQALSPFLGQASQWHLITFGHGDDSWCQPDVIWITGQDHRKIVCKIDTEKWLLLSGPHGLIHLNAYLNQFEPTSGSFKDRLHDILSFYDDRGLLAVGPDTNADTLCYHRGKNTDALRSQISALASEERFELAADHTFIFEGDVQTRMSHWGEDKRAGFERWTIRGTLDQNGIHISSIRYVPVHENIFLRWDFMDDGL